MAQHDVVISGGVVVDGSGAPAYRADVAIDGRAISAVGQDVGDGAEVIDATGCIVAPGFVDPHTHLDMQLLWDPTASPTCRHGVTTVTLSSCGFGIAPSNPADEEYLLRSLEVVEEIPYGCSSVVQPFRWRTWGEYLDAVGRQPLGVNVTGFVPHSALRRFVMGDRATTEAASAEDRREMTRLLEAAMEDGAVGFSSSRGPNHMDAQGVPVPSRFADDDELRELVEVIGGRVWQINLENKLAKTADRMIAEIDRYAAWTAAADATLSWTPLTAVRNQTGWRDGLRHSGRLRESGINVRPQVTPLPITVELAFDPLSAFLTHFAGWNLLFDGFEEMSRAERIERLTDRSWRRRLREAQPGGGLMGYVLEDWTIISSPSAPESVGRAVADLSADSPLDELLDLVVADELGTLIQAGVTNQDTEGIHELLRDETTLLGLGDSGAHVTSLTTYAYPTFLLQTIVRERNVLSLEEAVRQLTSDPASVLGLRDRGLLQPGLAADVCVFDHERLGLRKAELRDDLPRGYTHLVQEATGYKAVLVNGERTIADDELVASGAGQILRVS